MARICLFGNITSGQGDEYNNKSLWIYDFPDTHSILIRIAQKYAVI